MTARSSRRIRRLPRLTVKLGCLPLLGFLLLTLKIPLIIGMSSLHPVRSDYHPLLPLLHCHASCLHRRRSHHSTHSQAHLHPLSPSNLHSNPRHSNHHSQSPQILPLTILLHSTTHHPTQSLTLKSCCYSLLMSALLLCHRSNYLSVVPRSTPQRCFPMHGR